MVLKQFPMKWFQYRSQHDQDRHGPINLGRTPWFTRHILNVFKLCNILYSFLFSNLLFYFIFFNLFFITTYFVVLSIYFKVTFINFNVSRCRVCVHRCYVILPVLCFTFQRIFIVLTLSLNNNVLPFSNGHAVQNIQMLFM